MKKLRLAGLCVVAAVSLYGNDPAECSIENPLHSSCNPYGGKLLTLDKVRYIDTRTPLSKLKEESSSHRWLASVPSWLERYVVIEPSLRFRGTALEKAIGSITQKVATASRKLAKHPEGKYEGITDFFTFPWGYYKVKPGDNVTKIAKLFGLKSKDILRFNHMRSDDILRVGQKLILPVSQEDIDVITTGRYRVKKGDTLIGIAKRFKLDAKKIARYNRFKKGKGLYAGRVIRLPFEHITHRTWLQSPSRRKLRVVATAYTSHRGQTDDTPFLAAWNNRLRPGMKVIAVSRDLITKYGITNGTKVKISGLPGYYTVRDKMNKRYKRRIDIYMGTDRRRALRWGRRNVLIYW